METTRCAALQTGRFGAFKWNFEVLSESPAAKLRKQPGAHYRPVGSELSNGTLKHSQKPRRQSYGNNPVHYWSVGSELSKGALNSL